MAMNKQRRTSNINNVVTYDTSNNVTVPASFTQGLVLSSLVKADSTGMIVAASSGVDFQSPLTLTTTGTSGAATLIGNTLNIPQYTAGSGTTNYVTKWATSSTLGDSLIYDNGTSVSIGTTSPSSDNKLQVQGKIQSNISSTSTSSPVYSVVGNVSVSYPASSTLGGNIVVNAVQGGTSYTSAGNLTIPNSVATSSIVAVSSVGFSSTGTITHNQAGTGIRSMSNIFAMWSKNSNVSGTVTHMSNLRLVSFYTPYTGTTLTVNNYYGIIIEDTNQFAGISILNKWAIYQEGTLDNNYFAGKVLIGGSTVGSSKLNITGLPTSASGLASGDVWNDGGTLKIA